MCSVAEGWLYVTRKNLHSVKRLYLLHGKNIRPIRCNVG